MSSPRIVAIGAHQLELESGLAVIRWVAQPTVEDSRQVFGLIHEHRAGRPSFYFIADVRKCGMPDAQTRRWTVDWMRAHPFNGYAYVGANRAIRAMLSLMVNVVRLLDRRQPPVRLFETEDEARAWIDEDQARSTAP